ncbi:mitochondrial chaperone Frataxin [Xylaria scruposa]|nr:mitochondrial chaperone Frataxin [Xylaria scruposa]
MARPVVTSLTRMAVRGIATRTAASAASATARRLAFSTLRPLSVTSTLRSPFSTTSRLAKPPLSADELKTAVVADITEEEYHRLADKYINDLLLAYESMQDDRADLDVDYQAGVMNLRINDVGTYVINKQPPNKQIWLSSPTSGPKRYDWVVISEGQDQKQDTARGDWIYMRDGTSLSELLRYETGLDVPHE